MKQSLSILWFLTGFLVLVASTLSAAENPFFAYLTDGKAPARMVAYSPLGLDPRNEGNQVAHATSELRKDLETLSRDFDGLVLYGYHPATTPRLLALASRMSFRAVLLSLWQPKDMSEVEGLARLALRYQDRLALAVAVGNEGLHFGRYEEEDLILAAERLRQILPASIPLTTSEPFVVYERAFLRGFGDFLAPNIHPVFDRKELGSEQAAAWAREQATTLAQRADKPVLLKETGFPHAGGPGYTVETQHAFWKAYTRPGTLSWVETSKGTRTWVFTGIAFEAFDLEWKASASGLPMEKSWGLFDTHRQPLPALKAWQGSQMAR